MGILDRFKSHSPVLENQIKALAQIYSVQDRFSKRDLPVGFGIISRLGQISSGMAQVGTNEREKQLRDLWKKESILAGAVGSMVQKIGSLGFTVTGGRNKARLAADVLRYANDGRGWTDYIQRTAEAFFTQDKGAITELGRPVQGSKAVAAIYSIDPSRIEITGNREKPFRYHGRSTGQIIDLGDSDTFQLQSMPRIEEDLDRWGFCAVSRAAQAAQLMVTLTEYDSEKLNDLPPQGIAAITGLTQAQVRNAIALYNDEKTQKNLRTFPGLLWLASISGQVKVDLTSFSELPDQFDRNSAVLFYVYTLAVDFGVDARELWPATIAGATKADALVQAMKAKGKGPGEIMTAIERSINSFILPPGVSFQFDFQDDDEDRLKAEIQGMRINNVRSLYQGYLPNEEPIVTRDEARQLLANLGVLPHDLIAPSQEIITDIGTFNPGIKSIIRYKSGIFEEETYGRVYFDIPSNSKTLELIEVSTNGKGGNNALVNG